MDEDYNALKARIYNLPLTPRPWMQDPGPLLEELAWLMTQAATLVDEVRRLRSQQSSLAPWLARPVPFVNSIPSPGVPQVVGASATIPLDPPLRVDAGDILLVRSDGKLVGRYDSDGALIESRFWHEDGTR